MSEQSTSVVRRLIPVAVLVGVMWLLEIIDWVLPADLDVFGIQSRELSSLPGIIAAPMLHVGFDHLMSNTVPFILLASVVALRYPGRFWPVILFITVGSGLIVWLLGPTDTITVGASGVIFGLLTFLISAGVITRRWPDVVIAAVVLFIYGGMLFGALPFGVSEGVSWLAHLAGAVIGVVAALLFAPRPTRAPAADEIGTAGWSA